MPMPFHDVLTRALTEHDEDLETTALTLSKHAQVSPSRLSAWADGSATPGALHLRALLTELPIRREDLAGAIDPMVLLAALWCRRLGEHVLRERQRHNLDLPTAARVAGVSKESLRRWEKASVVPRVPGLRDLLATLGLSAEQLLPMGDWPPAETPRGNRSALGTYLRQRRMAAGLTQQALACAVGVTQASYSAWENGRTYPEPSRWRALSADLSRVEIPLTTTQLRHMQLPQDAVPASTAVAHLLGSARVERRLARAVAAELVGVSVTTWNTWEAGTRAPHRTQWKRLRACLGLDVDGVVEALTQDRFGSRRDTGTLIWGHRTLRGWTGRETGERTGIHRNRISEWELGLATCPDRATPTLARALRVPVATLRQAQVVPELAATRAERGARLREARLQAGLSQYQVAKLVQIEQSLVSAYERGRLVPPPERAAHLRRHLGANAA